MGKIGQMKSEIVPRTVETKESALPLGLLKPNTKDEDGEDGSSVKSKLFF